MTNDQTSITTEPITGAAAGVPFIAFPPSEGPRATAPLVLAWHLQDAPRTPEAFAAAVPLAGLDAWRVYLGLPLSGSRKPTGGDEEIMRLGYEDAVMNLQGPICDQAAAESVEALPILREKLGIDDGPVALLGASMGAAVALRVIVDGGIPVTTAVLVSPLIQLRPAVDAMAEGFGFEYAWTPESAAVAERMDLVARASEVPADLPVLLVVGSQDHPTGFLEPAVRLQRALADSHGDPDRSRLITIDGMGHALALEPGEEPAPQTPHSALVDQHAVSWLRAHLPG